MPGENGQFGGEGQTSEFEPTNLDAGEVVATDAEEEKKTVTATIEIDVSRHGKKAGKAEGKLDYSIRLSTYGRFMALSRGLQMGDMSRAMAAGSPRERSQETAGIIAKSNQLLAELGTTREVVDSIFAKKADPVKLTEEEAAVVAKQELLSLEHLQEMFDAEYDTENGEWIREDDRLNFVWNGPVAEIADKRYVGSGDQAVYLVNESDHDALETGDLNSSTYTEMAGAVAELLSDYVSVADELGEYVAAARSVVLENPDETYKPLEDIRRGDNFNFRRIFGTHGAVGDSFVVRVVEELERSGQIPAGTREKILAKIPNGFPEAVGFKFIITSDGEKKKITLKLSDYAPEGVRELELDPALLEKIISERNELVRLCQKVRDGGVLSEDEQEIADKITNHKLPEAD